MHCQTSPPELLSAHVHVTAPHAGKNMHFRSFSVHGSPFELRDLGHAAQLGLGPASVGRSLAMMARDRRKTPAFQGCDELKC